MIVLDTNVLSELMKSDPAGSVVRWVDACSRTSLFTTSITMAEIMHGIRLLPVGRRRDAINAAAESMFADEFLGRVLPFDGKAAHAYANLVSDRRRLGRPISQFDAQIAAITFSAKATLATRNVKDFSQCGIAVIDPWAER